MNLTRRPDARNVARHVAVVALLTAAVAMAAAAPASAQMPTPEIEGAETIPTPDQTLSDEGRTVSAGDATMTVSQASGLDPDGQTVHVTGSGFDENKGVYLALCVVGPRDDNPSPCGGGAAIEGSTGASIWISSNPPRYGAELVEPWGPDGSFEHDVSVAALISDGTTEFDCREVQCAITTRNDHTRPGDRGQDLLVPVFFEGGDDPTVPSDSILAGATGDDSSDSATDDADTDDTATSQGDDDSGTPGWVFPVVGVVIVVAAVGGAILFLRRRSS